MSRHALKGGRLKGRRLPHVTRPRLHRVHSPSPDTGRTACSRPAAKRVCASARVHRARLAYERARDADEKQRRKLYAEARGAEVEAQNERLEAEVARLENLLAEALEVEHAVDFESLKKVPSIPPFDPGSLAVEEPAPDKQTYLPPALSFLASLLPWVRRKHESQLREARARYDSDLKSQTCFEKRLAESSSWRGERHTIRAWWRSGRGLPRSTPKSQVRTGLRIRGEGRIVEYCELALRRCPVPKIFLAPPSWPSYRVQAARSRIRSTSLTGSTGGNVIVQVREGEG